MLLFVPMKVWKRMSDIGPDCGIQNSIIQRSLLLLSLASPEEQLNIFILLFYIKTHSDLLVKYTVRLISTHVSIGLCCKISIIRNNNEVVLIKRIKQSAV